MRNEEHEEKKSGHTKTLAIVDENGNEIVEIPNLTPSEKESRDRVLGINKYRDREKS